METFFLILGGFSPCDKLPREYYITAEYGATETPLSDSSSNNLKRFSNLGLRLKGQTYEGTNANLRFFSRPAVSAKICEICGFLLQSAFPKFFVF